jgi:hypothetical protein
MGLRTAGRAIFLVGITDCEWSESPMANAWARTILVGEMDVSAYTEQQSFLCCFPGRRCAIEALGIGWRLLSFPHAASS